LTLLVLVAIGFFADGDGLCYPSLRTIQKLTKISRKTIIDAVRWLEAAGELLVLERGHRDRDRVKDRRRRGGFQPTNYYQLLVVNPVDMLHDKGSRQVVQQMNHLGGSRKATQVVQSAAFSLLYQNKSVEQVSATSSRPCVGLMKTETRNILSEKPELVGLDLLKELDLKIRHNSWYGNVAEDDFRLAIEEVLSERAATSAKQRAS